MEKKLPSLDYEWKGEKIFFIRVVGEELLDENGNDLIQLIEETLSKKNFKFLAISLQNVGFADSAGISSLIAAQKIMDRVEGHFALICDCEKLHQIFNLLHLSRVFKTVSTIDQAMIYFNPFLNS